MDNADKQEGFAGSFKGGPVFRNKFLLASFNNAEYKHFVPTAPPDKEKRRDER